MVSSYKLPVSPKSKVRICFLTNVFRIHTRHQLMNLQVMVPLRYQLYLDDLKCLVESGEIPMTRIDDAVERILRVKFIAGLFEYPLSDRSLLDKVGCKVS